MKDAQQEEEEKKTGPMITKKQLQKELEQKISDEQLYRPHGQGLDAGHY